MFGSLVALKPDSEYRLEAIASLHEFLLRPYLGKKNGLVEAAKALGTKEVLTMLWDLYENKEKEHPAFFWWNAPCFVEALKKMPRRKALEVVSELAEIHDRYAELTPDSVIPENDLPIWLLLKLYSGDDDVAEMISLFGGSVGEGLPENAYSPAVQALCRLLGKMPIRKLPVTK